MNERLPQSVQCRPSETYFSPSSQVCDCIRNTSNSYSRAISKTSRKKQASVNICSSHKEFGTEGKIPTELHSSPSVSPGIACISNGNLKGMYFFEYGNVISIAGKVGLSLGYVSTSPEVSIREPPRDPWDNQPLGHSSNAA